MKDELKFDASKITAGQVADLQAADIAGDWPRMARIYAPMCTALPKAWGELSVKTFEGMTHPQSRAVILRFNEDANTLIEKVLAEGLEVPENVKVDLHNVKATDMMKLRREWNRGNVGPCFELLTKMITACPWGDPSKVKTFRELPNYTVLVPLVTALVNDAYDAEKNERSAFGS